MSSLFSELEGEGFILPDFKKSNYAVTRQLVDTWNGKLTGDKDKKIYIILDGFGYNILERLIEREADLKKEISNFSISKITSVFPSSTMNALSSTYSGFTTAEHGVVSNTLFVKELGMMVNAVKMGSAAEPGFRLRQSVKDQLHLIFPKSAALAKFNDDGRSVSTVYMEQYVKSGLCEAIFDGDIIPYTTFADMLVRITMQMEKGVDLVMAYSDVVDHTEHVYMPYDEGVHHTLYTLLHLIAKVLVPEAKRLGYNIIITADHGQTTEASEKDRTILWSDPIVKALEMPPWGEPTSMFFSVTDGREREFMENLEKRGILKDGLLVDSGEAIRSGLFGKNEVKDELRYRFGTHILIMKDANAVFYNYPGYERKQYGHRGMHGGLSPDEMYLPLMLYE